MMFANNKAEKPMTEREVVAQSMTFLLAGYETTSAVLAFLVHSLAHNQDVQSKLADEIDQKIGKVKLYFLRSYIILTVMNFLLIVNQCKNPILLHLKCI